MTSNRHFVLAIVLAAAALAVASALGQSVFAPGDIAETQRVLAEAREQGDIARVRAEKLEADARRAAHHGRAAPERRTR